MAVIRRVERSVVARDLGARPRRLLGRVRLDRRGPETVPDAGRGPRLPRQPCLPRPAPPCPPATCRTCPSPPAPDQPAPAPPALRLDGYALTGTALSLRGTPYRDGGTDRRRLRLQRVHAVRLRPARRRAAARGARSVRIGKAGRSRRICAPGDLIFFTTDRARRRRTWRSRSAATSSSTRRARPAWCASSASARATGRRGSSALGGSASSGFGDSEFVRNSNPYAARN